MTYMIRNNYSTRILLYLKEVFSSNNKQFDVYCSEESLRKHQVSGIGISSNLNDEVPPVKKGDACIQEHRCTMQAENIFREINRPLAQERTSFETRIGENEGVIEEEKECEILSKHLPKMYEQPVKEIYLYDTLDDSSVSTLGSLDRPLSKVVPRNILFPSIKGTWNDEKIITVSHEVNRDPSTCVIVNIAEAGIESLSKETRSRFTQGSKQRRRDSLSDLQSGKQEPSFFVNGDAIEEEKECKNLPKKSSRYCEQPVESIFLYDESDCSSVLTFGTCHKYPIPILKGSWDEEKIVTVLLPNT